MLPVRLRLRELLRRNQQGTLKDLCQHLQVDYQTVANWNQGRAFPNLVKALALCQLLQCTMEELVEWGSITPPHGAAKSQTAEAGLKAWASYVQSQGDDLALWSELFHHTMQTMMQTRPPSHDVHDCVHKR